MLGGPLCTCYTDFSGGGFIDLLGDDGTSTQDLSFHPAWRLSFAVLNGSCTCMQGRHKRAGDKKRAVREGLKPLGVLPYYSVPLNCCVMLLWELQADFTWKTLSCCLQEHLCGNIQLTCVQIY